MSNNSLSETTKPYRRQDLFSLPILKCAVFISTFACCISTLFLVIGDTGGLQLVSYFVVSLFLASALSSFLLRSFYDNIFFVVLINSIFPAYCLALVLLETDYFIAYCFPLLVLIAIFTLRFAEDMNWNFYVPLILFLLVVPSLFGSISSELVSIDRTIVYLIFSFVIPLFFFIGINSKLSVTKAEHIISVSFIVLAALSLVFIPIEILSRGSGSVRDAEVGGRSYTLIAVLVLILPVIKDWLLKQSKLIFWSSCTLFALLIVFSFSRGVIFLALLALFPFLLITILRKPTLFFKSFFIGSLILLLIVLMQDTELISEVLWFWSLRLNIFNNETGLYTFELSNLIADAGRLKMWENALNWSAEEFWFGYGLGSSAELIIPSTGYRFGFGGMHNQSLTVLVERGVFGVIALLSLWSIYLWKIYKLKAGEGKAFYIYCFLLFLLYAHTTGIEILVVSAKDLNSHAISYLLMMLALINLKHRKLS